MGAAVAVVRCTDTVLVVGSMREDAGLDAAAVGGLEGSAILELWSEG